MYKTTCRLLHVVDNVLLCTLCHMYTQSRHLAGPGCTLYTDYVQPRAPQYQPDVVFAHAQKINKKCAILV